MDFGRRLRELREAMNLTQEELGKLVKQTKANISKYETGKLQPNLRVLIFFADYFGVPVDYLLGRTGDPAPKTAKDGLLDTVHR